LPQENFRALPEGPAEDHGLTHFGILEKGYRQRKERASSWFRRWLYTDQYLRAPREKKPLASYSGGRKAAGSAIAARRCGANTKLIIVENPPRGTSPEKERVRFHNCWLSAHRREENVFVNSLQRQHCFRPAANLCEGHGPCVIQRRAAS